MKNNIIVREARLGDSGFILSLRNEIKARLMSINQNKIAKKKHNIWFLKNLSSNRSKIYIGTLRGKKFGVINFQKKKIKKIEVSINIKRSYRKKGLSSIFLNKAIKNIEKNNFYSSDLLAKVKRENNQSIKLFIKTGFKKIKKNKSLIFFIRKRLNKNISSTKYNLIIKNIERTRSKNNVNWMNLLRIVFKIAPSEGRKILEKININDKKISSLVQKLGK